MKLQIPLAWYSPDPMHAAKSRFKVPNRRFKGFWNLIFSKKGSIWGQNFDLGSCMEWSLQYRVIEYPTNILQARGVSTSESPTLTLSQYTVSVEMQPTKQQKINKWCFFWLVFMILFEYEPK